MTYTVMTFESKPEGMSVRVGWDDDPGATGEEKRLAECMAKILKDLLDKGIIRPIRKEGAQ